MGEVPAARLAAARLELHWAAQVLAAAADGWLAHRDDDSHTAMTWRDGALVGETAPSGLVLALEAESLELVAIRKSDGRGSEIHFPLADKTLADALAWADRQHAEAAGASPRAIATRSYDMPAHAVQTGAAFSRDAEALAELAAWYGVGVDVLAPVAGIPLRVWPHHFDLGTIIYLDEPGERARQIGLGLSPGDSYYAEPYFYVTPHPIPDGATFGPLAGGGFWRAVGWTGAVLTATAMRAGDARARAASFVETALAQSRLLLGLAR